MRGDVSCIRSLFLELLQLVCWHSSEGKPYTGLTVLQEERLDLGKAHMDHTQCTQHWPQGPQQLHTALAPGSSTAAHSTGPRALNSGTQHWPQGPRQLHTATNKSHFGAERGGNFNQVLLQWCHGSVTQVAEESLHSCDAVPLL